jgi:DeoR/GlpR family transcriptional regulator of sugar metabolism
MYEFDRLREIQNILMQSKSASVKMLGQKLYVSEATVRRDLNALEKQGLVRRVFGGVVLIEGDQKDIPFYAQLAQGDELKEGIALEAIERIKNGDVLMLDASSTVSRLIRHLKRFQRLTIITNSGLTMSGLQELDAKVIITGGLMMRNSQGFVGNYAEEMVRNFNADLFFFSCGGLSADGRISDMISEETSIRRVMLSHSRRRILLCDSSKFGRECCYNLCTTDDVDEIISDQPYPSAGRSKQP